MPLGLDLVKTGDDVLRSIWAHTLTFGTSTVLAFVQPFDPMDPEMPTGIDPREVADIHMRRDEEPDGVIPGSIFAQEDGQKWKVWRRLDNPADFNIVFRATKYTPQDQA